MSAADARAAWLVDLDGTLYDARPVKLCMAAELLVFGLFAARGIRAFRRAHEALRETPPSAQELHAAGGVFALQLSHAARASGLPQERLARDVREWMIERPGKWLRRFRRRALIREIEAFRARGGRTALVSDYPASDKLAAMGIAPLFELVVANGEPGGPSALKPAPDGYLAAARGLGCAPADCLVIGDRADADGAAAAAAGMAFRLV